MIRVWVILGIAIALTVFYRWWSGMAFLVALSFTGAIVSVIREEKDRR